MKAKNVLDKLKDLKLRRWGPAEYTKAKNSNGGGGGDENSGNFLMSLIPNDYHKPDLFLFYRNNEDDNPIDVTNYKIDDLVNLYDQVQSQLQIMCLYKSSNLDTPIIKNIKFGIDSSSMGFGISYIPNGNIKSNEVSYNNKLYYFYIEGFS